MSARTRSVGWAVDVAQRERKPQQRRRRRAVAKSSASAGLARRFGTGAGFILTLAAGVLFGRLSMMSARGADGSWLAGGAGWQSEGLAFGAMLAVVLILMAARGIEAIAAQPPEGGEETPRDVSRLGHELRTPLNAIIGFSEAMRHGLLGPIGHPRYQEYAHHISASGQELQRGIEQVLADAEAMARRTHLRMH
jgi:signal transduction histidine kinase